MSNWYSKDCTACSGTGYYDNTGSPKCSNCSGKGYIDYQENDNKELIDEMEDLLVQATREKSHFYVKNVLERAIKALRNK